MVRGELGTYPCSVSCDGAGGGETGWCSVTCCQEPADRPKTGAWRTGSGAALRLAGLEAEETPPPHPPTHTATKKKVQSSYEDRASPYCLVGQKTEKEPEDRRGRGWLGRGWSEA